jgi:hypothetical protein
MCPRLQPSPWMDTWNCPCFLFTSPPMSKPRAIGPIHIRTCLSSCQGHCPGSILTSPSWETPKASQGCYCLVALVCPSPFLSPPGLALPTALPSPGVYPHPSFLVSVPQSKMLPHPRSSTWLVPPHPEGPSPFTAPGIFPVFVATRDLPSSLPVFLLWPFRVCLSYWEHLPRRQGPGAPLSLGVHFCVST